MAITCIILAVVLGYSTSKYFPDDVPLFRKTKTSHLIKNWASAIFYGIALVLFILEYGSGTGTLIFLFTTTLNLCLCILALSFNPKLIYTFWVMAILLLIFDIIHYAS